jgi:hypothetical protein
VICCRIKRSSKNILTVFQVLEETRNRKDTRYQRAFDSVSVRTLTYNLTDPPILFDAYYLSAENAEPKLYDFTSHMKRKEDYKNKRGG